MQMTTMHEYALTLFVKAVLLNRQTGIYEYILDRILWASRRYDMSIREFISVGVCSVEVGGDDRFAIGLSHDLAEPGWARAGYKYVYAHVCPFIIQKQLYLSCI